MMAGMGLREKTATQCCQGVFGHMSQGTRQRDTAGRAQLRFEKTRVGPLRGPTRVYESFLSHVINVWVSNLSRGK